MCHLFSKKTKRNDPTDKKSYRPISVLPATSKVYERLIQAQIIDFNSEKLSHFLYGKDYSAQHALILLIEHWRKALDKQEYAHAMDRSKAFDCINHNLLIAKLDAYGFQAVKSTHILLFFTFFAARHFFYFFSTFCHFFSFFSPFSSLFSLFLKFCLIFLLFWKFFWNFFGIFWNFTFAP